MTGMKLWIYESGANDYYYFNINKDACVSQP